MLTRDTLLEVVVLFRVEAIERRPENRNGMARGVNGGLMGGAIDTRGKSTDHGDAVAREGTGKYTSSSLPFLGRPPRADYRDARAAAQ